MWGGKVSAVTSTGDRCEALKVLCRYWEHIFVLVIKPEDNIYLFTITFSWLVTFLFGSNCFKRFK